MDGSPSSGSVESLLYNPFGVQKAVHYGDQEIVDKFVEFPIQGGFRALLNPTSSLPQLVVGNKGSGRTHLLRWLSYPAQQLAGRTNDFIGVYIQCTTMAMHRFTRRAVNDERIAGLSNQYFDLWVAERVIQTVIQLLADDAVDTSAELPADTTRLMINLFDDDALGTDRGLSLEGVRDGVVALRRELDHYINNFSTLSSAAPRAALTTSRFLFELSGALCGSFSQLSGKMVVLLIDEFENLEADHQQYVQTLVREVRAPTGIIIGARSYGIRTYDTLSGERNREDAEFRTVDLERIFSDDHPRNYQVFCADIIKNRLGLEQIELDPSALRTLFPNYPRRPEHDAELIGVRRSPSPAMSRVRSQLNEHATELRQGEIDFIVGALSHKIPLYEQLAVFRFFKAWAKRNALTESAREIAEDLQKVSVGVTPSRGWRSDLSHYRADLNAQALRWYRKPQRYAGFENLTRASASNPRNFVRIMFHLVELERENGLPPAAEGLLAPAAPHWQSEAVKRASATARRELNSNPSSPAGVETTVERFARFLQLHRFSDKPTEASLSALLVPRSSDDSPIEERISECVARGYLLVMERTGKNSRTPVRTLQLSPILAPSFSLPIARRGVASLNRSRAEALLVGTDREFERLMTERASEINAPFRRHRRSEGGRSSASQIEWPSRDGGGSV